MRRPIVSSAHLVSDDAAELSEFEFGLIIAGNASAGHKDLSALDILALHSVNHRAREKKLADICFVLNVEDSHTVAYALKKLARLGLIERRRQGKENFYRATAAGRAACARYREVREDCLVEALSAFAQTQPDALNPRIGEAAALLRALSGLYDQAARAAASL